MCGDPTTDGEASYSECVIRVNSNPAYAEGYIQQVFLHELMHCVLYQFGMDFKDEALVDNLARAMHAVITDNPDIFR
jgi:predicted SprT family Zn-dependent metalloprotease